MLFTNENAISFTKFSGAGNDFVIINNLEHIINPADPAFANFVQKVCERRMSVGADGVLLVENAHHAPVDFQMRYFNADGGEAETCGNGARCISKFAYLNHIAQEKMSFLTNAGIYESEMVGDDVKLRMSDPTDIRLNLQLELEAERPDWVRQRGQYVRLLNLGVPRVPDSAHTVHFVNTGVPHAVLFVDDVYDLTKTEILHYGKQTRHHAEFQPAGTNANFVQVHSQDHLSVRTYERGVENETLACGTGAVAVAVISAVLEKVAPPVRVTTASKSVLTVDFNITDNEPKNVYLEGDARVIYTGELTPDAWNY